MCSSCKSIRCCKSVLKSLHRLSCIIGNTQVSTNHASCETIMSKSTSKNREQNHSQEIHRRQARREEIMKVSCISLVSSIQTWISCWCSYTSNNTFQFDKKKQKMSSKSKECNSHTEMPHEYVQTVRQCVLQICHFTNYYAMLRFDCDNCH